MQVLTYNKVKKAIFLLCLLVITVTELFAQNSEIKTVHYASTDIDVPASYTAKDEYSIENNLFSGQWLYFTNEMVGQGVPQQVVEQFEQQIEYSNSQKIEFISNGGEFSGKKYRLKNNNGLKYKILAFGSVDGQALLLNLGFRKDPKSNDDLDELMKKFILFDK